ncbi:tyrosine-type recombinase/integrase [Janthinobacterium sp. SUN026]|uniref:tyrosine-type recombinase/integrase n=1 Tax=Janthinobacterium sp. SUN026 TaxID=3002438 RepID=UPI0025AF2116|nr:integrase arm-type DNA-binding domain-containing protein [Janthinobacterium sp. SUN026]MDN2672871.1 tyrosine-type recombinase/integrase [Janthinobacterium sp. SUN026]
MLTDAHCRNAKPREKLYRLNDFKGLYLEIKPSGVKAWRYRFKLNSKESLFALGDYPDVSLADARDACGEARKLVKQGISPVQNRQLERVKRELDSGNTFEVIAQEWLALKDWEDVTKTRRLDMLQRVVFPSIGKLPVRQITSAHVLDILNKTVARGAPTVAAEAKRTMSSVFELAVATLRADTDPVWAVRKALPPNKTQHKRALSVEEIGKLLVDFDGHGGNFQTLNAFRLMWLTLVRPNESVQAEWEEFDLDSALWKIPAQRMKARREHVLPLPEQAVKLLKAMRPVTGHTKYVFPNRDDRARPMADAALRQALKKLGWAKKYSPHGTRTTGSTRLNELGYRHDVIEAQLAHAEPNAVRRTYNHATYLDERRGMMQDWADLLDTWKAKT